MTWIESWSGEVDAKLEDGQPTGLMVENGDVITVVANGWAERGPDKTFGPQGDQSYAPEGLLYADALVGALLMKIGDQIFAVNGGLFSFKVPADGEIKFLFNDAPGTYENNSGSFTVSVGKEGDMKNMQTGVVSTDAPPAELQGGNTSTFVEVTFPQPFPDGSEVIVIPMVQTFNGQDTPGLRVADVTTKGFKIRMNELVADKKMVHPTQNRHGTETIGWAAFTL